MSQGPAPPWDVDVSGARGEEGLTADVRWRLAPLFAVLALTAACVDGHDPVGPDLRSSRALAVLPMFAVEPTNEEVGVLSFARILATDSATGDVLGRVEKEIDPEASEWFFDLTVVLPSGNAVDVVVTVELLSDIVEWSGQADPIRVAPGADPVELKTVPLLRGPLDNLDVTRVELTDVPEIVAEGVRGQAASTMEGGGEGSRVFYTSLTPSLLEVTREGEFRAVAPGMARIEARAGAVADTAVVDIQLVPVEDGDVLAVSGGIDDSVSRLAPGLQDAAGAQAIVESLSAFDVALGSKRASQIIDAVAAAREALAAYGDETIRYQDGPELSLIELVLDYTERVVLEGINTLSSSK